MILAQGKFIYQGPCKDAVNYFSSIGYVCPEYSNPADYFIEISHSDGHDDEKFTKMFDSFDKNLAPNIVKSIESVEKKELVLQGKVNSFFYSMKEIAKRSAIHFKRNPVYLKARIGQTLVMSFLICSLYFQLGDEITFENIYNRNGAFFFISIGMFMSSMMPVVLNFPAERAVFLKEYSSNMYGVAAYFFGRQSIELPLVVLFPILVSAICYYIIGFNSYNAGKWFIFTLFMIAQSLCGNALGILAGSAFSDPKVATNVVPLFMLPLMVFGGFYINSDSLPDWLEWFQWVSPYRYCLEGLMRNEYSDSAFGLAPVEQFNFNVGMWGCFGLLIAIGMAFRILALVALKKLVRKLQ